MHSKRILLAWSLSLAIALALTLVTSQATQAQTLQVLHAFTGDQDGGQPFAGLIFDQRG